jgi:alkylated DNA nucleotide flippase Atl1
MQPQEDAIVDIPPNRIRYFGGPGKMLLPSAATVAALIKRIPRHQLLTTDRLRQELTEQFDVQGTCPVTTQKALQTIAHAANKDVAYWRVINKNGDLIARFPGGVEGHAALLRQEGFTIDATGKVPKVKQFRDSLVHFG